MRNQNLPRAAVLVLGSLLAACGNSPGNASSSGGAGGSSIASGSGGSGETGGAPGSGGSSTAPNPGSPHLPPDCHDGFTTCDAVCAHLDDDSLQCGACGHACDPGSGCVGGECVAGQGCIFPALTCGHACTDARFDAANCGACDNRCADAALCVRGVCLDGGGDGQTCAAPLAWEADPTKEQIGFHFSPPLTAPHTFSCAGAASFPTRWFRFTATQTGTDVEIRSSGADDYVIEVFSAATCAPADVIACDDDHEAPDPKIKGAPTVPGASYWIAVGLKRAWSGEPAVLRVDF